MAEPSARTEERKSTDTDTAELVQESEIAEMRRQESEETESNEVVHEGSCHCGAVKWIAKAPRVLKCIKCNCSICQKKGLQQFIIKREKFTLVQGGNKLKTYTFNTKIAQHRFCKKCGVQSFYIPRSNPDCVAVMPHCIDSMTVDSLDFDTFDGQNWEKSMEHAAPEPI